MIITNNAVFLLLPKTGGTWLENILRPISLEHCGHSYKVPEEHKHKPIFSFVRNPWSWTVSGYNDLLYGTDTKQIEDNKVDLKLLGFDTSDVDFDKFLNRLTHVPESMWLRKSQLYYKLWAMQKKNTDVFAFWMPWLESNQTFYEFIAEKFINPSVKLGKVENMRNDLEMMLEYSGDLTDELKVAIRTSPKKNLGRLVDYRTYYNEESKEAVRKSAQIIINEFSYAFE